MTPDGTNSVLSFSPERFPFHDLIAAYIGTDALSDLEAGLPAGGVGEGASLYKNMEAAPAHVALYEGLQGPSGEEFYALYRQFLREVIAPQFDGAIYYQRRPSHRILFRDTPGSPRYHRDRDYGHDPAEVNYLVPQTRAFATNAMWLESAEDEGDFEPVELELGEYLRFDGANCRHGAHANESGYTRVSFDFRVIPAAIAPASVRAAAAGESGNPVRDNALAFELLG